MKIEINVGDWYLVFGIGDLDLGSEFEISIGDLISYYLIRIRLQLLRCFLNGCMVGYWITEKLAPAQSNIIFRLL